MSGSFSKMQKQAQMMQKQFAQMKEQLATKTFEGSAGNGLVTVTINGEKDLKKIIIKPECLSDAEGLQDLILGAFEDANKKLESMDNPLASLANQFPFFN
jgi:DNA-binding YbaB/EbfC family protein